MIAARALALIALTGVLSTASAAQAGVIGGHPENNTPRIYRTQRASGVIRGTSCDGVYAAMPKDYRLEYEQNEPAGRHNLYLTCLNGSAFRTLSATERFLASTVGNAPLRWSKDAAHTYQTSYEPYIAGVSKPSATVIEVIEQIKGGFLELETDVPGVSSPSDPAALRYAYLHASGRVATGLNKQQYLDGSGPSWVWVSR